MAYGKILQRLLQNFFLTQGRAPITAAEWSKLRRQAMELARKEGGDPITGAKISPQPKLPFDTTKDLPGTGILQKRGNIIPFLKQKGRTMTPMKGAMSHEGIQGLMKKGDVTVGTAPKTTPEHLKAKKDRGILLRDSDEAIADIKRKNKQAVEDFKKKFRPDEPDKFQFGGIAPLVGEPSYAANFYDDRTPMKKGKKAKKKKKTAAELKKELVEDLIKQGVPVEVIKTVMRELPRPWERLPHGRQRYRRKEDLPEGILELLQKDPGFDREAFEKAYWAGEDFRWTDPGWSEGLRGQYSGMTGDVELNLAPFGQEDYPHWQLRSPHQDPSALKDVDKAKIALHELRHKNIMEDPNLFRTQPEWVQRSEGSGYLPKGGVTGHELYNRFLDQRYYPPEEKPGPNDPYFDKILKDYWEPYAQDYEKTAKRRLTERHGEGIETLAAQGGRIGMAGGGAIAKFIEKLFIKASNDIRLGRGKWKGLDHKQRIVQHDNLTKKLTEWEKTGKTVGLEEYFGVDPHTAFIGARDKVKRQGIIKDFPEVSGIDDALKSDFEKAAGKKVDKDRKLTEEEWKDFVEDNSGDLNEELLTGDETLNDLENMVAQERAYADDMYQQYKRGDLDKYVKPEVLEEQRLFRQKKIDKVLAKAYDEVFYQKPVTGDYKLDADVLSDSIAEQLGKGAYTDLPQTHQTQIYNTALKRVSQDMQMKQTLKNVEEKMILSDFDVKGKKPHAEGGRAGYIFGGSAGLKGMWKQMMKGLSKGRDKPITKLFPKLSAEEKAMEKVVMGTPEQKAFREGEVTHKLEGIDILINRLKHDKKILERQAKNKAMGDPGLDFLMKKLEENMSEAYTPHLKKYTDIDKDILQMENIKKNLIMKDRKLNAYGGRIGYSGGGQAGLPAVTMGTPQMNMQQPQMPAGPQPAGIPGGTIVAQNQMQQAPWMGSQMQQGPGGMPRPPMGGMPKPQPGGMPRPMAAEGGRIGFGLGGFNKARRAFLKLMAGITGGGIAAGTGLLKYGSKAAPKVIKEAEVIARGADGMPKYLVDLIEVVKAKGARDVIEGFKRSDYSTVHRYKGVEVIEEAGGATRIKQGKETPLYGSDEPAYHEIEMEIRPQYEAQYDPESGLSWFTNEKGRKVYETKIPDEYAEYTAKPDMDGKLKDVDEYIDDMDHLELKEIADEVGTLMIKKTKKASGGLAYALGE